MSKNVFTLLQSVLKRNSEKNKRIAGKHGIFPPNVKQPFMKETLPPGGFNDDATEERKTIDKN